MKKSSVLLVGCSGVFGLVAAASPLQSGFSTGFETGKMKPFYHHSQTVLKSFASPGSSKKGTSNNGTATPPAPVHKHFPNPIGGYSPAQIKAAYGIDKFPNKGAGQTIAIVDAYGNPTMKADVDTFSKHYGVADTSMYSFTVVNSGGAPDLTAKNASGWMVETTLDVEWAHAMAPLANIILVVAQDDSTESLFTAVQVAINTGANVVSMSFGGGEDPGQTQLDAIFNVPGVTFVAASGDSGAGVGYPAASPFVIGVGGTTLTLDSSGAVTSEVAWSGSGGGISAVEPEPDYQKGAQSTGKRGVPDVAYNADPQTGYSMYFTGEIPVADAKGKIAGYASGWWQVGGTSAGAPQWAALIADTNSEKATADVLASIYSIASSSSYTSNFREITSGCDGNAPGDCAKAGYNTVTGLGSPLAQTLLPALSK